MAEPNLLRPRRTTQAEDLYQALEVFDPKPLVGEAYNNFYYPDMPKLRGSNAAKRLQIGLLQRVGSQSPFKTFLIGTSGCGKSTEMETLRRNISRQVETLSVSARESLDMTDFEPFDFLFLVSSLIAERTHELTGQTVSQRILERLQVWGSDITDRTTESRKSDIDLEAGVEAKTPGLLGSIFKANAAFRSKLRFTSARSRDVKLVYLRRIDELTNLVNQVIDDCNILLRSRVGKEWLVIAEDFDKADINPQSLRQLVVNYGQALRDLNVHMILNMPRFVLNEGQICQFPSETITDVPVFNQDHRVEEESVKAIKQVVEKRARLSLFDEDTLDAAIVSSGGLFSALFKILTTAVLNALELDKSTIGQPEMHSAIRAVRAEFRSRLSPTPYETTPSSPEEKVQTLEAAYREGAKGYVPDSVALRLIDLQLILTHNNVYWFSVHPLAVDHLATRAFPAEGGGSIPAYR